MGDWQSPHFGSQIDPKKVSERERERERVRELENADSIHTYIVIQYSQTPFATLLLSMAHFCQLQSIYPSLQPVLFEFSNHGMGSN